jgi:hypothetical protein
MKDLKIVRLMSVVVALAVLSTGCASKERTIARRLCKIEKKCFPEQYVAAYIAKSECVDRNMNDLIEAIDEEIAEFSQECGEAHLDFLLCATKKEACSAPYYIDASDCGDQYSDWGKACN